MSLLQNLPYKEYDKYVSELNIEQCATIANIANISISFSGNKKPGELLIKYLDRAGCSVTELRSYINTALNEKPLTFTTTFPQIKVAILIANEKYEFLSKLATPCIDCDSLANNLKNFDFVTVIIKNTNSKTLKEILVKTFEAIPEDSYCLIFYAGHGCELCNAKCILGIDSPLENIEFSHCVTENWLLREVAKCKPDLCVLIMDMCRINLDRKTNPKIYTEISDLENYTIHNNLLIAYSTQAAQSAYEVLQIECSTTFDNVVTYELQTGDTERIVPGASQYVNALCTQMSQNIDISALLDKVHEDVEKSVKKQRPIKVQCGVSKRALNDPSKGFRKLKTEPDISIRNINCHKKSCFVYFNEQQDDDFLKEKH